MPKKPIKPRQKPALRLIDRQRMITKAVDLAFKGISGARFVKLTEHLYSHAVTLLSIARRKPEDAQIYVMWSDDPAGRLYYALHAFASYTDTPVEQLVEDMIMRIGPSAGDEYRWN